VNFEESLKDELNPKRMFVVNIVKMNFID